MPTDDQDSAIHALPQLFQLDASARGEQLRACLKLLDGTLLSDRSRFLRQLASWQALSEQVVQRDVASLTEKAVRLQRDILASSAIVSERLASNPRISYPEALPISAALDKLRSALSSHQVVVVAGETGSGKTTQLPKLCLEIGRGVLGRIGHTQPRRLAARTVAARIAEELACPLGQMVGFAHRFAEEFDASTRVLVMTDGSLLAQLHRDPSLRQFDTIIIDEAHERSLNIDFLLGVLKRLLPKRPDLKVLITSATIDIQRFSEFFNNAPCISVEGRGFPVELEYLPELEPVDDDAPGATTGKLGVASDDIAAALTRAMAMIEQRADVSAQARDVLVFLPGEREIRDASLSLRRANSRLEVLPLYARLPVAEQQRIFNVSAARSTKRRVVLATNVAETSLTVPGIGYVIDAGLARVNRFSARSKLQRLQIEPISKASAAQRAGRAGRLAPGVCLRLYSREDFEARSDYTEPEIMRTQLASVILQMKRLGLGDLETFPLLEQPAEAQRRAGMNTLQELGALAKGGKLSAVGKRLAAMPLDPQLGRMLLAAEKNRCIDSVLVIVSAMAVQDPREFPADKREASRQAHKRFSRSDSDFLDWLTLWDYYASLRSELGQSKMRKRLQREFLSPSRLREWHDMHRQLRLSLRGVGIKAGVRDVAYVDKAEIVDAAAAKKEATKNTRRKTKQASGRDKKTPAVTAELKTDPLSEYQAIHRSLLQGIPLQLGLKDQPEDSKRLKSVGPNGKDSAARTSRKSASRGGDYQGPRGLKFALWPGSALASRKPRWVMAAEIVETSRVYARHVAAIEPAWAAAELSHLTRFEYGEPVWQASRGRVVVQRRTLLFGLTLNTEDNYPFDKIDAGKARELFIQSALVERQLKPDRNLQAIATFWQHNNRMLDHALDVEEKLRRRDLQVSDEQLYAFYDARLPDDVFDRVSLGKWLQSDAGHDQSLLKLDEAQVFARQAPQSALEQFPSSLRVGDTEFPLRYAFAPGADNDGVTVRVALDEVARMPLAAFEWLVPGMLPDKVEETLKLLPKAERKKLLPLAQSAASLCERIALEPSIGNGSLYDALATRARQMYGVSIDAIAWRVSARSRLPEFYQMRAEIVGSNGAVMACGRNLAQLQRDAMQVMSDSAKVAAKNASKPEPITRWNFGSLEVAASDAKSATTGGAKRYLHENNDGELALGFSAGADEARAQSQLALPTLAMHTLTDKVRYLRKQLCRDAKRLLPYVQVGDRGELVNDLIKTAIAKSCFANFEQGLPEDAAQFERSVAAGSQGVVLAAQQLENQLYDLLQNYQWVCELLAKKRALFPVQCDDVKQQLDRLVYPGFVQQTGFAQFEHLTRYVEGAALRLDRLGGRDAKDLEMCEKLSTLQRPLHDLLYKYPYAMVCDPHVRSFRWLLEELRVSLFAQQLKTVVPVSHQRVLKAWQAVDLNLYPLLH